MPLITPYMPTDLSSSAHEKVEWHTFGQIHPSPRQSAIHSVANMDDPLTYPMSLIECEHPEGKIWQSMFIPLSPNGAAGVSVTWWGKSNAVKGQCQVKEVSESDWYTVVKSKAVAKGYKVLNYVGRTVPLNVSHQFVKTLVNTDEVAALPVLAFANFQSNLISDQSGRHGIGMTIAKVMNNFLPVENFLSRLSAKGFSVGQALEDLSTAAIYDAGRSDILQGIRTIGIASDTDSARGSQLSKKAPEPEVDREEVYGGGWGAFG